MPSPTVRPVVGGKPGYHIRLSAENSMQWIRLTTIHPADAKLFPEVPKR